MATVSELNNSKPGWFIQLDSLDREEVFVASDRWMTDQLGRLMIFGDMVERLVPNPQVPTNLEKVQEFTAKYVFAIERIFSMRSYNEPPLACHTPPGSRATDLMRKFGPEGN